MMRQRGKAYPNQPDPGQIDLFEENRRDAANVQSDAAKLFELSVDAFYTVVHARMSELPIEREIVRFIGKVGKAKDRAAAARIAFDRGDPDVLAVQKAARKALWEIHRITGFLRFSPDPRGVYTARCGPDCFILPALAEHFRLRFGETPWAIIDERRGLRLYRETGGEVRLIPASASSGPALQEDRDTDGDPREDPWEDLWRLYHHSVSNEARKNPKLQRQFMPERYRKYLPEFKVDINRLV